MYEEESVMVLPTFQMAGHKSWREYRNFDTSLTRHTHTGMHNDEAILLAVCSRHVIEHASKQRRSQVIEIKPSTVLTSILAKVSGFSSCISERGIGMSTVARARQRKVSLPVT